jgi:hypothetical protein
MREPIMDWYFESYPDDERARPGDSDAAQGQIILPAAVLQRHGAVMLEPGRAARAPGQPEPRPTVYRTRSLLVPADLLAEPALGAINTVPARVGMRLVPPERAERPDQDLRTLLAAVRSQAKGRTAGTTGTTGAAEVLTRLPLPAALVPAARSRGEVALPVVVDAWIALQTLRAAASPELPEHDVRRIGLEHLLVSASVTGAGGDAAIIGSPVSSGHGLTSPGTAANSYVFTSGDTRSPVKVALGEPARRTAACCQERYGRRPVIAVPDSGVRAHPWLDVRPDPAGGYLTVPDGFVAVDQGLQNAIYAAGYAAHEAGDHPRQLIGDPWDSPVTADPLIGGLDTETGHGSFIAGLVRQVAPDAQVLAVRIMHSDGIVYEGDLTCALSLLAARILAAQAGDLAAMVDAVSLSLGYFGESPQDVVYSSGLWLILDLLLQMGVAVVAAAGNFATSRKFWPAAFSGQPAAAGQVPLISVGALNPNGSKAAGRLAGPAAPA